MDPLLATLACFLVYVVAYRFYAGRLATHLFALDPSRTTPAHACRDEIDYVPANRYVLFGHHFTSITGLSPMLGPAIAVIWGWVPAMLWVVLGAVLVGAVHDFSALVVSVRAKGMSIGKVAESIIGHRAKTLFHIIIFFLIALAMGVFVQVVGLLFSPAYYPQAVLPSGALMAIAVVMGLLIHRRGVSIFKISLWGFTLMLVFVWAGIEFPVVGPSVGQWMWLILGYAFLASVLPVWLLLQPRDYINGILLILGLLSMYAGLFVMQPEFAAPALNVRPEGAPAMFPFVFIVIACGAASGFHALVSSGTTAKQLDRETDARLIGYGSMIGESLLGLMAVLACSAGFFSRNEWLAHYGTWESADGLGNNIAAFVLGTSRFLQSLGLPGELATTLVALIIVSFALTTVDSATRLLRYNITEIGETRNIRPLRNRYISSGLAVAAIAFFAFYEVNGQAAGQVLWQLFGTTNQLMAGLALLAVTLYLLQRGKPVIYTLLPMVFMLLTTLTAMAAKLGDFWRLEQWTLLVTGGALFGLALWLVGEAWVAVRRYQHRPKVQSLDVAFEQV